MFRLGMLILIASAAGILFALACRQLAFCTGVLNYPNPIVPQHVEPVPYLGGVAIALAAALSFGAALLRRTTTELVATRALPANCEIIGSHVIESEYGYVVFDDDREEIVARLQEYFVHNGIDLIGRYGRWEYTSMAQVLRQGNDWAQAKLQQYLGAGNL